MVVAKGASQEEFFIESGVLRAFTKAIEEIVAESATPAAALGAMRAPFARLLADRDWPPVK